MIETYRLAPHSRVCETAECLRDAPKHPHIVAVIGVEQTEAECAVTSEDVVHDGGVALAEVFFRLSLAARLRIVVDVLAALSALHTNKKPVVHGGVLLRATFVDKSGHAKVGCAYAQSLFMKKDSYAPEALLGDEAAIAAHTDVYGAGVLLWEAITGRELFGIDAPEEILKKQLAGRIAKALPPARDRWARTVLPVIERSLEVNPSARYATIAEMAAALRIAVRARLMTHEDVVEEIWPAATTPKVQSGVQPAADEASEPVVAEASMFQVVATPSAPIALTSETDSVVFPLTPDAIGAIGATGAIGPSDAKPWPSRSRFFARLAVGGASALVVALVVVGTARLRHTQAPLPRSAENAAPAITPSTMPAVETVDAVEREEAKPTKAPATASSPPPAVHKPKAKARFYDPSSI